MTSSSSIHTLELMAQTLFDKKARNILILDVKGLSPIADYFVIAEGSVNRHVKALADNLVEQLIAVRGTPTRIDGERFANWIVLDYVDIVIHLFIPEFRERYALEKLWHNGRIVDIQIDLSHAPLIEEML